MKQMHDIDLFCEGKDARLLCSGISIGEEARGKCILLCGANGSGKSTLLRLLSRENRQESKMIPTGIPKVRGFRLKDFVVTSCYKESRWDGRVSRELDSRVDDAIRLLGLSDKAGQDISTLSDGEFQKACIAVAVTLGSECILLDEPTAFLDPQNRITVLRTLRELSDKGKTVVFSSHDLSDSLKFCNEVWAIGQDKQFHKGSEEGLEKAVQFVFSDANGYI